jgi:hypothetical protein
VSVTLLLLLLLPPPLLLLWALQRTVWRLMHLLQWGVYVCPAAAPAVPASVTLAAVAGAAATGL